MGIEPTYAAWEAQLNLTRSMTYVQNFVISAPIPPNGYEGSAKLFAHPAFPPNAHIASMTPGAFGDIGHGNHS